MKGVIEVRGADGVPPPMVKALAAFWKGILYSRESRDWAWDLVRRWSLPERVALRDAAGREGLRARTPDGRTVAELAVDLVEAAKLGLCRQGACGQKGEDERILARPARRAGRPGPIPGRRGARRLPGGRGRRALGPAADRRVGARRRSPLPRTAGAWEDAGPDAPTSERGSRPPPRAPAPPIPASLLGAIGKDAPFGIAVVAPDLRCEVLNAAFGRMVGVDPGAAPGRPFAEVMPGASPGAPRGDARGARRRARPLPHPGGARGGRGDPPRRLHPLSYRK